MAKALAPDLHDLEPTLTRYGYNIPALAELLNLRQAEVRGFLHGQLPPGRTAELHQQLLAVTLFAVRAGRRACLQAVCTRVLAHSHGVLARRWAYSHTLIGSRAL